MGNESSRELFAESLEKIQTTDVSPDDTEFWDSLWRIKTTPYEVFEVLGPEGVRRLKSERAGNLATLFTQAVAQLCQVVETPMPAYFDQALTCIRVLTRLVPVLLDSSWGDDPFVKALFWGTAPATTTVETDADGNEVEVAVAEDEEEGREPLAALLIQALINLLFLNKFTLSGSAKAASAPVVEETGGGGGGEGADPGSVNPLAAGLTQPSLVWVPGVGRKDPATSAVTLERNRTEVLRLLLACLCDPLFQNPDGFDPYRSKWQEEAASGRHPLSAALFCSLLNVGLSFDPVGWGVPYGASLVDDAPQRQMEMALQTLLVLLDYGIPAGQEMLHPKVVERSREAESSGQVLPVNAFRQMLACIQSKEDFQFIYNGLVKLLNNVHEAVNTYMPGSVYQCTAYQELLILLWKLLEENGQFTAYVLKHCDITQVLTPICYLMFEARRDDAKIGLVHICTFLLLRLSGERNFGVALNKLFDQRLPMELPIFKGNFADFLIVVLHKMIVTGSEKLSSLYHCFMTIVCNISPYTKSLSLVASVKMVNLFELFTSPRILYGAESNYLFASLLLEIFNNLVQYQYGGNQHLVYAIVRRKELFIRLSNLTLAQAIKACESARKQAQVAQALPTGATLDGEGGVVVGAGGSGLGEIDGPTDIVDTKPGPEDPIPGTEVPAPAEPAIPPGPPDAENKGKEGGEGGDEKKADKAGEEEEEEAAGEASAGTGATTPGGRFQPTQEWVDKVQSELQLTTVLRLLTYLVPQIEEMCNVDEGAVDEGAIVEFLSSTTMVGLLPVPHPIVIRKYQPNHYTALWFTAFMWGVMFLRNQSLPIFDGQQIKLFTVTIA